MDETKHTPTREAELNARIREVPLLERLDRSNSMIAKMCSERRPPKMTIPVQWYDEDYFICLTVKDAKESLASNQAQIAALREKLDALSKQAQEVIDQMIMGKWVDQAGNDVRLIKAIFNLPWAIREARAALALGKGE